MRMSKTCRYFICSAAILCGFARIVLGSGQEEHPTIDTIKYVVTIPSTTYKPVSVDMRIYRTEETKDEAYSSISLYQGMVKVSDFKVYTHEGREINYFNRAGRIMITLPKEWVDVKYNVRLGELDKHGHQGIQTDKNVLFGGEHVFFMPFQESMSKVEVEFKLPKKWKCIIPHSKGRRIVKKDTGWFDNYTILKNCYAFGSFRKKSFRYRRGKLRVWFPVDEELAPGNPDVLTKKCFRMYKYFAGLFGRGIRSYDMVLLGMAKDGKKIISGTGDRSFSSTIINGEMRDWQLMAHRMTHSYIDNYIKFRELHSPSSLWLLEAMTTYYENMAMGEGEYGPMTAEEGFADLFRRYLFYRTIRTDLRTVKPGDEAKLTGRTEVEYLHYTVAPLTLIAMDDMIRKRHGSMGGDYLLKWCIENSDDRTMFTNMIDNYSSFLGNSIDGFIDDFVKSNYVLPLWDRFKNLDEDPAKVVEGLEYYDNVLASWYKVDEVGYESPDLSLDGIDEVVAKAEAAGIHIPNQLLEQRIKDFSPTIYKLLIKHFYLKTQ